MATPRKPQNWSQPRERAQTPPLGSQRTQAPAASSPTPDRIAARAYQIWLDSGRPEGKDQENWFTAERELRGGSSGQSR